MTREKRGSLGLWLGRGGVYREEGYFGERVKIGGGAGGFEGRAGIAAAAVGWARVVEWDL